MIGIFVNLWSRISGAGAYLLDQFGGAAAAYSLRRLSSSYGGPAIRVRRSLDNAEQDIGFQGKDLDQAALNSFVGYQNLITYSEQLNNSAWLKNGANITSNDALAPDGVLSADKISEVETFGTHKAQIIYSSVPSVSNYTWSFYAKASERTNVRASFYWASSPFDNFTALFNLSDGTVNSTSVTGTSSIVSSSIESVGNGWYRCSITGNTGRTGVHGAEVYILNSSFQSNYTGILGSGLFIWGAQLTQGSLQPYQQTVATAYTANGFVTEWYTQDSAVHDNLLTYSEQFDNAAWGKINVNVSSNSTNAPNGTLTADKVIATVDNLNHIVTQNPASIVAGLSYTFSFYAKSAEYTKAAIRIGGLGYAVQPRAVINLLNGQIISQFGFTSLLIDSSANGFYRISGTFVSGTGLAPNIQPLSDSYITVGDNYTYAGDGTSGIFIWGAQISPTSWLQPYQQTVASAITRRDAIQTTAANQPQIVNGGNIVLENGKPAMLFDGVNDFFSVPSGLDVLQNVGYANSFSVTTNNSSANVNKTILSITTTSNTNRFFNYYNGTNNISSGGRRLDADSFFGIVGSIVRVGQTLFYSAAQYINSDLFQYGNGSLDGSSTSFQTDGNTSNTASANFTIGSFSGTSEFFNGDMQEITLYNTNQLPNRVNIESSINSYYKIY